MSAEQRLQDLNIALPLVSAPAANYANDLAPPSRTPS